MPDLPETNAGLDYEKTVEADRQATAAAVRAERKLAEQRLARAQRKAQAEEVGVSAADFASHGDFVGGGDLNTDFAKRLRADMETRGHNKRQSQMDLEAEANRVAADFANDQAVQRDKEREAAEAAAEVARQFQKVGSVAGVVATGLTAIEAALGHMQALQISGARETAVRRRSIGESMAVLGYDKDQIDKTIMAGETKGGIGAFVSQDDIASLYSAAASGMHGMPANAESRKQQEQIIDDVRMGRMSMDIARAKLSSGPLPLASGIMIGAGGKPLSSTARKARMDQVSLDQIEQVSQAEHYDEGQAKARFMAEMHAQARDNPIGAAGEMIGFNSIYAEIATSKGIGSTAAASSASGFVAGPIAALIPWLARIATNTVRRESPPSTTGGR